MKLMIDIPKESYEYIKTISDLGWLTSPECANSIRLTASEYVNAIKNGTPITSQVLADALMEERIRGELNSDTDFEKDVIRDVKCRLTVSIKDHRPCYCGAGLREVWRESE